MPLNPVGNIIFTDKQKQLLQNAFNNPSGSFPDNTTGYFDDIAELNTRAEEFRSDMSTTGDDRGAWDIFHPGEFTLARFGGDTTSESDDVNQPFPPWWNSPLGLGPLYSNRNIHAAALKAYALDDVALAGYVFDALLQRAQDEDLDYSNGGSRRLGGEPTKTNSTYGTVERFPYERQEDFRCVIAQNYFMVCSKMEQYLVSFLITYDLIKNTTNYINNGDIVTYWFQDFYRFVKFSADRHTNYWLGSNWRSFQQDWARPTNIYSGENVAYSAPSTVLYNTSDAAAQGIQNRAADTYCYISSFGKAFPTSVESSEANSFAYDIFRAMMAICVFADGTSHEHYRWSANPDYIHTQYIKWMFMAHTNEVAVERGYLPISEKGKFYDYTTFQGTDELFSGATFSSTSGGPKSLSLVIRNLGRYFRNSADGGYRDVRYTNTGVLYDRTDRTNLIMAVYLSYDDTNQEIRDFKNFNSSAGYVLGLSPTSQANGQTPHSLGTGWGFGQAIGGHIAFGETNAFGTVTSQPVTGNNSLIYYINP